MSDMTMRGFVRAFCDAFATQNPDHIGVWLDDDIDWIVFGPVDLFPFFGQRDSKVAVLAACAEIGTYLAIKSCDKDSTLIEGEQTASLIKLTTEHRQTGRTLSLRLALFAQFRAGKVVRLRALFDSFDAAEQALGREIDLTTAA